MRPLYLITPEKEIVAVVGNEVNGDYSSQLIFSAERGWRVMNRNDMLAWKLAPDDLVIRSRCKKELEAMNIEGEFHHMITLEVVAQGMKVGSIIGEVTVVDTTFPVSAPERKFYECCSLLEQDYIKIGKSRIMSSLQKLPTEQYIKAYFGRDVIVPDGLEEAGCRLFLYTFKKKDGVK